MTAWPRDSGIVRRWYCLEREGVWCVTWTPKDDEDWPAVGAPLACGRVAEGTSEMHTPTCPECLAVVGT